jgi:anti-anti-sigma factor
MFENTGALKMFKFTENDIGMLCEFSSNISLIDRAISAMRMYLSELSITEESFGNIELVSRELMLNAIEHGNESDITKTVSLSVAKKSEGALFVSVKDEGEGFDSAKLNYGALNDYRAERSRGLAIVNSYSDDIQFSDSGNTVTAIITLPENKEINVKIEDKRVIIQPSSDLTAATADMLRHKIKEATHYSPQKIAINFSNVKVIDSIALSTLALFAKQAQTSNIEIEALSVSSDIKKLFNLTRLSEVYNIIE